MKKTRRIKMLMNVKLEIINRRPVLVLSAKAQTLEATLLRRIGRVANSQDGCLHCNIFGDRINLRLDDGIDVDVICISEAQRIMARRISYGLRIEHRRSSKGSRLMLFPC